MSQKIEVEYVYASWNDDEAIPWVLEIRVNGEEIGAVSQSEGKWIITTHFAQYTTQVVELPIETATEIVSKISEFIASHTDEEQ